MKFLFYFELREFLPPHSDSHPCIPHINMSPNHAFIKYNPRTWLFPWQHFLAILFDPSIGPTTFFNLGAPTNIFDPNAFQQCFRSCPYRFPAVTTPLDLDVSQPKHLSIFFFSFFFFFFFFFPTAVA